jgi:uncharacterized protein YaiE (UPF0345 family)
MFNVSMRARGYSNRPQAMGTFSSSHHGDVLVEFRLDRKNVSHFLTRPARSALMSNIATQFTQVTAVTKANVYFEGRVVSHTLLFPDGSKKTLGLIYPGQYHFGTDKAEVMEIVAGACAVRLDGQSAVTEHSAGERFEIPAKSGFDIEVKSGICEYICSFIG